MKNRTSGKNREPGDTWEGTYVKGGGCGCGYIFFYRVSGMCYDGSILDPKR